MRRDEIKTPALILDLDHLDRNIEIMTAWAKSAGVSLRPHAKSHKSPDIARRLLKAGALGACCATIAEAEALAAAGITGLHITSPMTTADMLARLYRLLTRGADIMVVADDPRNVDALGKIASEAGRKLPVIVEIDVGTKRTGCVEIDDAVALAKGIAQNKTLSFAGVQAYWGHLQHLMPFEERKARVALNMEKMRKLIAALEGAGLPPQIITGSGTGTHWIDAQHKVFTELQAGSFVFLDSCYGPLPLSPDGNPFTTSLFVAAGVVTANRPDSVTVNAGYKALATDSGQPQPVRGIAQGASYRFMGDEHGVIDFDPGAPRPELGAVIELVTSHCDPTVNLHARYVVVRDDEVVDEWPILARGY